LPASNGQPESFVAAVSEVSERVTVLVREEIELAKAEMTAKAISLGKGAVAAILAGVFGFFALIFGLSTIAWAINDATGHLWLGFLCVFALLALLGVLSVSFAVRKLKVGAPAPKMAIDEAKLIRQTVSAKSEVKS
jgi:uncharacterized membrane protein YqjE